MKSIWTMCKLLASISNMRHCIRNPSFSIRNKIVQRKQIKMRFPKDAALKLRDQAPSKPKIYHVSYLNKIQSWLNWRSIIQFCRIIYFKGYFLDGVERPFCKNLLFFVWFLPYGVLVKIDNINTCYDMKSHSNLTFDHFENWITTDFKIEF